jgi:hypothetical protein
MKRAILGILVAVAVVATVLPIAAQQGTKYGTGVALKAVTPIDKLLADPKAYVGKTVRVNGVVKDVCTMAGCWMELVPDQADPKTAKPIRIKVEDGVIVFPQEAKGKKASAEGVFEQVSGEMAKEYAADLKKEGKAETKDAVPTYQVKATGAVIY